MRFRSSVQFAAGIVVLALVVGCGQKGAEKTGAMESQKAAETEHGMGEPGKHVPGAPVCPVSGHDATSETAVVIQYEGKEVRLCCQDCVEPFNKEPAKYMAKLESSEAPVPH